MTASLAVVGLGASLVYAAAVFCNLPPAISAVIFMIAGVAMVGILPVLSQHHAGGVTGDVLGSLQQTVEIRCLTSALTLANDSSYSRVVTLGS